MADEAASSPAETPDVFNGETPTLTEFNAYRETGEVPERFKAAKADSAPAATPEKTVESEAEEAEPAPESEPEETQEHPPKGSGAEKRIKQLLAEKKQALLEKEELQRKLEAAAKPDAKPGPSPAQPANYQEWKAAFNPDKWIEEFAKANPGASYEKANAEMFSHMQEVRDQFRGREQADQRALAAMQAKMDEARSRYEDADDLIFPTGEAIRQAQMPQLVRDIFEASDVLPDLLYVVSDPDELKKFISLAQTNPRAAIAKIVEYERGIHEELAKGGKAPEQKKTAAPKPPSPVGGSSSRAFDVSDESLSAEEWMRKRNAQLNIR